MRTIHRDEGSNFADELSPLIIIALSARCKRQNFQSNPAPGLMLLKENINQARQLPRIAEAREYMLLLRSLVIVVNEVTDDLCRLCEERWVEILVGRKLAKCRKAARDRVRHARASNLREAKPPLCSHRQSH